ncbi:MAG: ATP-binding protein [Pseudonocardia sp.]|uniref:ATP-binding protein n=1 Tax=unclassified Pseudonocardia TaxID=2619320 RepID=UPI000B1F676A|nr:MULTISPECIES: ATP-binding protein [unclassified Pseudonocardia]MBN9108076.1 ATP-binding protein [Pseudonocardia sp.]
MGDTVDEQERSVPLRTLADPARPRAGRAGPAPAPPTELALQVPPDPAQLAPLRRSVVAWARALDLTEEIVADLQLAVGEAAANGVEHAYPDTTSGLVEVTVRLRRRRGRRIIAVRVCDHGCWRPPPADPGYRGRGIAMIRAVAHDVAINAGAGGTEVTFSLPAS